MRDKATELAWGMHERARFRPERSRAWLCLRACMRWATAAMAGNAKPTDHSGAAARPETDNPA